jgi:hypothetical protein
MTLTLRDVADFCKRENGSLPMNEAIFGRFEPRRLHSFYSGKHARYFWLSDVDLLAVTTA